MIEGFGTNSERVIPVIEQIDKAIADQAKGTTSMTGTGGMITKIEAAKIATLSGIPIIIASGRNLDSLALAVSGQDVGTLFVPSKERMRSRKRWIAFFHRPKGTLTVDEGAFLALRNKGKSLLAPGITQISGKFKTGDIVRICDLDGREFARGIAGLTPAEIKATTPPEKEVVHRDDLVLL